jgi:hypothetical protein
VLTLPSCVSVNLPVDRDERVSAEIKRLRRFFKDMPKQTRDIADGLIVQAARLRILLDDMWNDIAENGDTERFSQSENTEPYDRERPVARLYNARDKNYKDVMRTLVDLVPEKDATAPAAAEELKKFLARKKQKGQAKGKP